MGGICVVALERWIELKLASGIAAPHRRVLSDVQDLIRALKLPGDFADRLEPTVRPMFEQLWQEAQTPDRVQEEEP
jgi:hypothetical protein